MKKISLLLTIFLCCSVMAMTIAGAESAEMVPDQGDIQSESELPVIGIKTDEAIGFQIVNDTGEDIVYFSIFEEEESEDETELIKKLQTALKEKGLYGMEIDGLYGPGSKAAVAEFRSMNDLEESEDMDDALLLELLGWGYDGNLLSEDDMIKDGETRDVYFSLEKDDSIEDSDETEKGETEDHSWTAKIKLASSEDEYLLHEFPVITNQSVELHLEEKIAYLCYATPEKIETVSTLQDEKDRIELLKTEPAYLDVEEQADIRVADADTIVEEGNPETAYAEDIEGYKGDIEDHEDEIAWAEEPLYDELQELGEPEPVVTDGYPDGFDPENPDWSLLKDHDDDLLQVDYDPMLFNDKERSKYESCDHEWVTSYWPDGSEFTECSKCHVHLNMWLYNGYTE